MEVDDVDDEELAEILWQSTLDARKDEEISIRLVCVKNIEMINIK